MSLCLRFPKLRTSTSAGDLVMLGSGGRFGMPGPSRIAIQLKEAGSVGRWDDEAEQVTVVMSGSLTSVPAPLRPGAGTDGARALASLYAERGKNAFRLVDGAYCAVVLDWRREAIVIARDKLGIARSYLRREGETVTFSDSLVDLLAAEEHSFDLDISSVYAFLTIGWIPTPHSMFQGVEKLPAGTWLESTNRSLEQGVYYDVPHSPTLEHRRSADELNRTIVEHLDRSVARGLELGGRWGAFLSGGVDSGSVVASLGRVEGHSFPTYFGGFAAQLNRYLPNPEEPAMSQAVSESVGSTHHMVWLEPQVVETAFEVVGALEEPVCDGGCLVLAEVMRIARNDADGLMTGIGGDFLFTGERRHMVLNLLRMMGPIPDPAWRLLNAALGLPLLTRNARISQVHFDLTRLIDVRRLSLETMYAGFFLQGEPAEMESLLLPEVRAMVDRDPAQEMNESFARSADLDPLQRFLYLDLKHQTPEHCVREAETLGRHFGVKVHHPFLDSEFVDFAMSIPASEKATGLKLKVPLKRAMRGRVPDEVLDRKKGGLGSPIRWWVTQRDGAVANVLSRENLERRGIVSPDVVERFRQETARGSQDHSKLLWSLFTLEVWLQQFVDARPGASRIR